MFLPAALKPRTIRLIGGDGSRPSLLGVHRSWGDLSGLVTWGLPSERGLVCPEPLDAMGSFFYVRRRPVPHR